MLLKKDLMNSMDSLYGDMLKSVSIPDFTKCIAQFSGQRVQDVPDSVIREYLVTWAENKYEFYKLLGNKIKLDMPITYKSIKDDICGEIEELAKEFPGFAPWLDQFSTLKMNKIENIGDVGFYARDWIRDLFPTYNIQGNSLTGFFKRKLNAPDELVTALGRIFENDTITGTYTISIDPVDMMLASENPYNWQSCYRLEVPNDASHADGCLAAILDTSSLITYIWDKEGKFNLYDHELKSVRYKRIREWISIAPEMTAIHFNIIYPGKHGYPEDFRKQLRDMVETVVARYKEMDNIWTKSEACDCYREFGYGYGEFDCDKIWRLKGTENVSWQPYDVAVPCPCGCGSTLPQSDLEEDYCYNGDGFTCGNFYDNEDYEPPYCSIAETYCRLADDICESNCRSCEAYDNEYPYCDLDDRTECDNVDRDLVDGGRMHSCQGHCEGCLLWAEHHPDGAVAAAETEIETTVSGLKFDNITVSNGNMGVWTFTPFENTSYYTATQEQVDEMMPKMPELPSYVTTPNTLSFSGNVSLEQIQEAIEQAPSINVLDITSEMIREAQQRAIENGTYRDEIVFGRPTAAESCRDYDNDDIIYGIREE